MIFRPPDLCSRHRHASSCELSPPLPVALRQRTSNAHQRVEAALPVRSEGLTLADCIALLRRLHGFYRRTDGELGRWALELRQYGIDTFLAFERGVVAGE